ncbi:hypothetical protein Ancab_013281 [Ancistrocladus abbreviatus]
MGRCPKKKALEEVLQLRLSRWAPGKSKKVLPNQPDTDVSPKQIWDFMSQIGIEKVGEEADVIRQISAMEQRDAVEFTRFKKKPQEGFDEGGKVTNDNSFS